MLVVGDHLLLALVVVKFISADSTVFAVLLSGSLVAESEGCRHRCNRHHLDEDLFGVLKALVK